MLAAAADAGVAQPPFDGAEPGERLRRVSPAAREPDGAFEAPRGLLVDRRHDGPVDEQAVSALPRQLGEQVLGEPVPSRSATAADAVIR